MFIILKEQHGESDDAPFFNGVSSIQKELPPLSLRDAIEENNSVSDISSPVPELLNAPLGPIGGDIGDLHEVPINDNAESLPSARLQSQIDEVIVKNDYKLKNH